MPNRRIASWANPAAALPALALAGLLAGCPSVLNSNSCSDFPASLGFQPLEEWGTDPTVFPDFPPGVAGDPYPEQIAMAWGPGPSYSWAHGRGYIHAPLAKVLQAIADPAAVTLHVPAPSSATPKLGVEPQFPVSFQIDYSATRSGITVEWTLLYRGGVLQGTVGNPDAVVGFRYQKTCGTDNIAVESGSLKAYPLAADPTITQVEMVGWLNAATQTYDDVGKPPNGTVPLWFADLATTVHALP